MLSRPASIYSPETTQTFGASTLLHKTTSVEDVTSHSTGYSSSGTNTPTNQAPSNSNSNNNNNRTLYSSKNFGKFLAMGQYTDYLIIDSNGKKFNCHKVILACHSGYFKAVFNSSFFETQNNCSHLTFPDPANVFELIMKFMYTLKLTITPETAIPILQQAEYYQVDELVKQVRSEMEKEYLPKHVICLLKGAVTYRMSEIIDMLGCVLAENFDAVEWSNEADGSGVDLNFLPLEVFLEILSNRALTLDTEYRVFKVISNYCESWAASETGRLISAHKDDETKRTITDQDCLALYSKVFFEHLSVEQLEEALGNEYVPRSLLCQGLLTSLRMALGKPVNQDGLGRRYTKHILNRRGRDFEYSGIDFDMNGVIYWLGTQLDENSFKNPHETGHVIASMSSIQSGKPSNLVSRECFPTCTMSDEQAHVQIDLGPSNFVLKPTAYTIRHGFHRDNVNLRRWKFQGSVDGLTWDTLHQVTGGDESMGGSYNTKTFQTENCEKWYRFFRVVAIGRFFVQIGGLEFYGNLLPRTLDRKL